MEIRYIPPSPKAGTTTHIENTAGRTLINAGFAEEICEPRRGSAEWLTWRNRKAATVNKPGDNDTPASTPGI
jgi:hypothetical protein